MRGKISPKFHVKNGVKNGEFHSAGAPRADHFGRVNLFAPALYYLYVMLVMDMCGMNVPLQMHGLLAQAFAA